MSRPIKQIRKDLEVINLRLNLLIEESKNIDARGKQMADRRHDLMMELEETESI